jgi:hypothetical protein
MLDLTVKGRFGKEMSMIQGVHRSKNVSGRVIFFSGSLPNQRIQGNSAAAV